MLGERKGEPRAIMLYLNRRAGEAVIVNNAIEVRVVEIRGRMVRLGFNFPANATVLREEVFLQIRGENEEAALTAACALANLDGPRP
jgi:carbon storage regulator